jgi:hypothetical protein
MKAIEASSITGKFFQYALIAAGVFSCMYRAGGVARKTDVVAKEGGKAQEGQRKRNGQLHL